MKKSHFLPIFLSIIFTFLLIWMMIVVNGGNLVAVLDLPTIAGIFICVPLLWASGYGKDFLNALKMVIAPLIFFSIATSISGFNSVGEIPHL